VQRAQVKGHGYGVISLLPNCGCVILVLTTRKHKLESSDLVKRNSSCHLASKLQTLNIVLREYLSAEEGNTPVLLVDLCYFDAVGEICMRLAVRSGLMHVLRSSVSG